MSLDLVISPYHLTTREAPAMAALLLADTAVTIVPTPAGARTEAESLAAVAPRYARLIENWRWSVPLWNEGVLVADLSGHEPDREVRATHAEIFASGAWATLRTLLEDRQHECEQAYLQALAHDLLRGGPDPALCIPVAAGLDRFASRHAAIVARPAPVSLAQKLEMKSATTCVGVTLPLLLEGRAERVLDAREVLADELGELREAFSGAMAGAPSAPVAQAATRYRAAFEEHRAVFAEEDPSEPRVVTGEASIRIVEMSSDAALESSERATRALGMTRRTEHTPGLTLAPGRTVSMVVRVIGPH